MSAKIAYRPDIDGLRTIAVGSVVAYHAFPALLPGGFIGVDIFFVISGFLITGILVREHERTGRVDLAEFYARRVRRLLPALLAVVATTLALGLWLVPATGELQSLAKSALAALFFTSNIFFALQPSGYFAAAAETYPLLHTWTLAVEEQFYIVWPLLIPLTGWIAARIGLSRHRALWILFGAVFISSLAISIVGTQMRPTWAFYLTPFRGWEFAIGAMLSLAIDGDRPRWAHRGAVPLAFGLAVTGLILIGTALWTLDHDTPFPSWIALLPTLGAAALLAAGAIAPANPIARILALAPVTYVGKLSYGWYLWHWPLLAFVRGDALGAPSAGALIAAVIASFLLSAASYHLIETPVRHQRPSLFRTTRKSLIAGVALLSIGAVAAGITITVANHQLAGSSRLQAIAAAETRQADPAISPECSNYRINFSKLTPVESCLIGDRTAKRMIILIGDSHGAHLIPMLDHWGQGAHVAILPRTRGGCRPLDGQALVIGIAPSASHLAECSRFRDAVLAEAGRLAASGQVIAIVASARWPNAGVAGTLPGPLAEVRSGFANGLAQLTRLTQENRIRLVLVKDTPSFPYHVPRCLARRSVDRCAVSLAAGDPGDADRTLSALAAGNPGIRLLDPSALICPGGRCAPIRDGVVLFTDDHHLSSVGSAALAAPLRPALDAAILGP
ncbi:acyltransferase family protein [Sphingomonas sp. ERG5]|uniref:acyltransferase family protein n=1 Tax=Sphingomonas sp. ERG5 TaxID=1381597 RepID=UPI00054BF5F4|nr:acyltransferase family protein [Sphingomonas sp. ERG5]